MMTSSTSNDSIDPAKVEWLLNGMKQLWGKPFVDKWAMLKPGEMLEIWKKGLNGISELEFMRGASKLKQIDRPINLPEFLKLCRPEVNPLNAYYEALEGSRRRERGEAGTWSHPAIFWASVRVSPFELQNQTYSQIKTRWESALAAELAKEKWDAVPVPLVALKGPGKIPGSKEKVDQVLKGLKQRQAVIPKREDPKGWAKLILARLAQGDTTLLPIQVKMARDALQQFEE